MKRLLLILLLTVVVSSVQAVAVAAGRRDHDHLSRDDDRVRCDDNVQGVPFEDIQYCVQSSGGFNPDFSLKPLPPGGLFNHATIQNSGLSVRNPDGTRTDTFRSTFITAEATPFTTPPGTPVIVSDGSCTGPEETLPDGSILFTYTCSGTNIAGFGAGDTFVTTGGATISQIGKDGRIAFNTNPVPPNIETVHISRVTGESFDFQRICTRAGAGELLRLRDHQRRFRD